MAHHAIRGARCATRARIPPICTRLFRRARGDRGPRRPRINLKTSPMTPDMSSFRPLSVGPRPSIQQKRTRGVVDDRQPVGAGNCAARGVYCVLVGLARCALASRLGRYSLRRAGQPGRLLGRSPLTQAVRDAGGWWAKARVQMP